VVDGRINRLLTAVVARMFPKRLALRLTEKMFRDMA
jgi:hypothetical protein